MIQPLATREVEMMTCLIFHLWVWVILFPLLCWLLPWIKQDLGNSSAVWRAVPGILGTTIQEVVFLVVVDFQVIQMATMEVKLCGKEGTTTNTFNSNLYFYIEFKLMKYSLLMGLSIFSCVFSTWIGNWHINFYFKLFWLYLCEWYCSFFLFFKNWLQSYKEALVITST